jgi:hypothetical protein
VLENIVRRNGKSLAARTSVSSCADLTCRCQSKRTCRFQDRSPRLQSWRGRIAARIGRRCAITSSAVDDEIGVILETTRDAVQQLEPIPAMKEFRNDQGGGERICDRDRYKT